ncbi:type VI secretion system baseplate subunit TssE [Pseudomonas sp. 148P]|uniref:Type VI secretion system baseplate subunit TssE n=1 Tax=Pseudomonas ulcerans TaxID=3115852 RepID=A0ABU7I072_9PSED|nr:MULTISPECIES: type VI secretion system baseplate subunit TssE [unclassified Pseudomonas]MEE1925807.1 type VI secretion system baseplate subunit TssE [Pseudomonas sp. 147P]MEE1937139.1 type VI secretion system baseplate subunit TssE [Pseudomonas sp. 148P]
MSDHPPSLYEVLLGNFSGELDLHQVDEQDQHVLSVLDNLQRLFNSRAGSLAHLPELGLPDMGQVMQSLGPAANGVVAGIKRTVNLYEPRLHDLRVDPVDQDRPGQLHYILHARLKNGQPVTFGTRLGSGGRVLVRHLKQQDQLSTP